MFDRARSGLMQAEEPFLELEECPVSSVPTRLVIVAAGETAPVPTRTITVFRPAHSHDKVADCDR